MAKADTQPPFLSLMKIFSLSLLAAPLLAAPLEELTERAPDFEWTAWGDSYASGVGAGAYIDGRRCLRYEEAYPIWIQDDPDHLLPGSGGKLNNVVCSGAKAEEVIDYQFYDTDQGSGQPNWQFYPRPAAGKPHMGTLTVGGDDIDFPGILNNCIIEGFPWPLSSGFTPRTCDEQREVSWSHICQNGDHDEPNTDLIASIDAVIKKAVEYGQKASGKDFKLYVTGYAQFFNDKDPGCDKVTFARTANPHNDGKPHTMMTTEIRQDFNLMSLTLNAAIKKAVSQNAANGVYYVDIDALMGTGHRFCEPGVTEPDQNNKNLWFFHYPYHASDQDPTIKYLNSVAQTTLTTLQYNPKSTLWTDVLNEFWDHVDEKKLNETRGDNPTAQADLWPDVIGYRAKVFHPQMPFHQAIYKQIITQYKADAGINSKPSSTTKPATKPTPKPSTKPTPTSAPKGYAPGYCCFHLDETQDCNNDSDNLWAAIKLVDNDKKTIWQNTKANGGKGMKINVGDKATFQGPLPHPIAVTGEHHNDYIQFNYNGLQWQSKKPTGSAHCDVGGWNPRDGPECNNPLFPDVFAQNNMDCCFAC